jgi:uncharacterized repeat protein (TIGR02543 family)
MKRILKSAVFIALAVFVFGVLPTGVSAKISGFTGTSAITDPDKIVEILVTLRTPSAMLLEFMDLHGVPMPSDFEDGMTFQSYALMGHIRFFEQLNQVISSDEYEVLHFGEGGNYRYIIVMRVRSGLLKTIAEIHEVFEITNWVGSIPSVGFPIICFPYVVGTPTADSITVNVFIPSWSPTVAIYRIESPFVSEWQISPVFTDLTPDTGYTFQAMAAIISQPPWGYNPPPSLPSEVIRTAPAPRPPEYVVTFDLNGGNIDGDTSDVIFANVLDSANVPPPTPTRDGYTFKGWTPEGAYNDIASDRIITAHWEQIPPPTITFTPESISIYDENLSQCVNVIGTATGEIIVSYDPDKVPDGVSVTYDATDATVTITGVRPATNVPAVTGEFDVSVTREGVTEMFAVYVNLSTTWTPPKDGDKQDGDNQDGDNQNDDNQDCDNQNDDNQNDDNQNGDNQNNNNQNSNNQGGNGSSGSNSGGGGGGSTHSPRQQPNTSTATTPTTPTEPTEQTKEPSQAEPAEVSAIIRLSLRLDSRVITDLAGNAQTMDVLPVVQDGRVLVPIRFIAEALGTSVNWNDDTREVTLSAPNGTAFSFAIGQAVVGMDVPAQIINDRTFVPLRFISEHFGATVHWCEETRGIEIMTSTLL